MALGNTHIDRVDLLAVLGVSLRIERNLLAFRQRLETVALDGREMHEHILTTVVIGDKSETLILIEPFHSTVIHQQVPPKKVLLKSANKKTTANKSK
jgi:hypothetical protein